MSRWISIKTFPAYSPRIRQGIQILTIWKLTTKPINLACWWIILRKDKVVNFSHLYWISLTTQNKGNQSCPSQVSVSDFNAGLFSHHSVECCSGRTQPCTGVWWRRKVGRIKLWRDLSTQQIPAGDRHLNWSYWSNTSFKKKKVIQLIGKQWFQYLRSRIQGLQLYYTSTGNLEQVKGVLSFLSCFVPDLEYKHLLYLCTENRFHADENNLIFQKLESNNTAWF